MVVILEMRFEWDEQKNQVNIRKHGISFELAQQIFESPVFSWQDTFSPARFPQRKGGL